jgi:hypothetical protein
MPPIAKSMRALAVRTQTEFGAQTLQAERTKLVAQRLWAWRPPGSRMPRDEVPHGVSNLAKPASDPWVRSA